MPSPQPDQPKKPFKWRDVTGTGEGGDLQIIGAGGTHEAPAKKPVQWENATAERLGDGLQIIGGVQPSEPLDDDPPAPAPDSLS